jgi:hypothetical protein
MSNRKPPVEAGGIPGVKSRKVIAATRANQDHQISWVELPSCWKESIALRGSG